MDAETPPSVTQVTTQVTQVSQTTGPDPTEVKPTWYWIKDAKGYGSVTVTMMFVAFWVTTLAYILSIVDKIGPVSIRPFDISATSTYFIPILTLYFGRKFTDAKFGTGNGS